MRRSRSARRKGVASAPATPASRAAASASRVAASTASVGSGAGLGTARTQPEASPSSRCAPNQAAASAAESTRSGARFGAPSTPGERSEKKAGKSRVPSAATATPRVSRASSVLGTSRMDLTPPQTTSTCVLPSSSRSALTSHLRGTQISPRPRRLDGSERHEGPLTSLTG